jgi:hypothetical protein
MLLRTIKQISAADTKRIEAIIKKETLLSSLNDSSLLVEQVEARCVKASRLFEAANANKQAIANLMKRHIKIGNYESAKNEFSSYGKEGYFRENSPCPSEAYNSSNKAEAYFSIGLGKQFSTVGLKILLEDVAASDLFSILPCDDSAWGTIKQIAIGFYNKRDVYEKLYETFLLKEKTWLEATLGETFTKNLLELFSVNTKPIKSKTFNITKANAFGFVMKLDEAKNVLGPEYKKIGFSGILCTSPKQLSSIEIKVFLGPDNTLSAEARPLGLNKNEAPFSRYGPPRPGNIKFEDNSKLSAVLEKENLLNDFLVNLEQLTNFGYEIYEKTQTNILVGNI